LTPARDAAEAAAALTVPIVLSIAVMVLAAGAFAAFGTPIGRGYMLMATGAFGSLAAVHAWLVLAGTLILTGLAAGVALRIGLNNFGAEGQYLAGALVAIAIGVHTSAWPAWIVVPLDLAAGALAGALLMLAAALLKLRRGVEETIVTLLLNVVMLLMVWALLDGPLAGRGGRSILMPFAVPVGLLIALSAAALLAAVRRWTIWGFALRALAGNAEAARFAGIPVGRMTIRVALVSGALAGVAGVCQITSAGGDPQTGLGYAGLAVAMLAFLSPLGIVAAGLFVAALMVGAEAVVRAGAPAALPDVLVALTLFAGVIGGAAARAARAVP
jgi:simple sugar transport system permease protein